MELNFKKNYILCNTIEQLSNVLYILEIMGFKWVGSKRNPTEKTEAFDILKRESYFLIKVNRGIISYTSLYNKSFNDIVLAEKLIKDFKDIIKISIYNMDNNTRILFSYL